MSIVHVYFTLGMSPVEANSVVVTIYYCQMLSGYVHQVCSAIRICVVHAWLDVSSVHSSVSKIGANGRVSHDSLTHSRLYCRDREKK